MAGDAGAVSGAQDAARQPEPIRVLIVDDHALFRRGLEMVLAEEADIAAYDAAADVAAQRAAISDAFIEDLCAIGNPEDVAAGMARYRAAGATNPMITNITGTDLRPVLQAAVTT